ncbi:MAG: hypothetical protein KDA59_07545 [Planctomycetales bacterium]|nr:hypothetical protein [Planctomycetales bacterium]
MRNANLILLMTLLFEVAILGRHGQTTSLGQQPGPTADLQLILDAIVAGCEANAQLISHGRASYTWITTQSEVGGGSEANHGTTSEQRFDVVFEYPLLRVASEDSVALYKPEYVIAYQKDLGPEIEYPAFEHRAVIRKRQFSPRPYFHPRVQWSDVTPHIASSIPHWRNDSRASITATRVKDGSIILAVSIDSAAFRGEYVVLPESGYGLIELSEFATKVSDSQPYYHMKASYRRIPSGAYIIEERKDTDSIARGDAYYSTQRGTIRLVSFSDERPAPSEFQLESMGLPRGARIEDKIHDRQYIFGVSAVTEKDIPGFEVVPPSGGARSAMVVVAMVFIVSVGLWILLRVRILEIRK